MKTHSHSMTGPPGDHSPERHASSASGPYGPDHPHIPSEKWAWVGLVVTLVICLLAFMIWLYVTGGHVRMHS